MHSRSWRKTLVAMGAFVAVTSQALAFEVKAFDKTSFTAAQAQGASILVHVTAPWCPTCVAQHKIINEIGKAPDSLNLTIFNVDFDSQQDVMQSFGAKTQSTLIAFKGEKETGRSVGATKAETITPVMMSAVK